MGSKRREGYGAVCGKCEQGPSFPSPSKGALVTVTRLAVSGAGAGGAESTKPAAPWHSPLASVPGGCRMPAHPQRASKPRNPQHHGQGN